MLPEGFRVDAGGGYVLKPRGENRAVSQAIVRHLFSLTANYLHIRRPSDGNVSDQL